MQANANHNAANPGLIRPPFVYLFAILVGLVLDRVWPIPLPIGSLAKPLGAVTIAGALAFFMLTRREFRAVGTPIRGNRPATAIVRTGPLRFSRNPIYLAFSLVQLGVAFWAGSSWVLVMLVPVIALIQCVVIAREERYLEAKFGTEYLAYKSTVRRWV
jgi:protein-S-isoprenylcysteine O-methyltransferase Ste14